MAANKPIYVERGWNVSEVDGVPRLTSTYAHDVWPVQDILDAECRCYIQHYTYTMVNKDMHNGHSCGIVGIKSGTINNEGLIKGQVGLFGTVREFERGYRGQHAFVGKIYTDITPCQAHWRERFTFSMINDLTAFQALPTATLVNVTRPTFASPITYIEPVCWEHRSRGLDTRYWSIDYRGLLVQLAEYYHIPLVRWKDEDQNV